MGTPSVRRLVAVVLLVAFSALLQWMHVRETDHGSIVRADAMKYVMYAYNLKHFDTFSHQQAFAVETPVDVRPDKLTLPGYPWFLQHFLGEGDPDRPFVARAELGQAALGVVSTVLAFLIACRLLPFGWAWAVGLLAATRPQSIVVSGYLVTEQLSTTLVLAFVLVALHAAAPDGKRWQAVLAGLLLGAGCLVRPQLQAVPWLVLLAVTLVPRWRIHLKQAALACAMFAAVVMPWHVRNMQLPAAADAPDLMPISVYHGTFPNFMYHDIPGTYGAPYRYDPMAAEHSRDMRAALSHVRDLFAAEPGRYLHWYLLGKPGAFLAWSMTEGVGDIYIYQVGDTPWKSRPSFMAIRAVHYALHWPLMLVAAVTLLLALWRPAWVCRERHYRQAIRLVSALLAYVIGLHMLGLPLPRYNLPFLPLEFALALVGLRALVLRMRGQQAEPDHDCAS